MEMIRYGLVALMVMGAFFAWVALRVNADEVEDDNEPLVDVPDQVPSQASQNVKINLYFFILHLIAARARPL